jgi:hypothetical protein
MPKAKAHPQTLDQTLDDLDALPPGFLALSRPSTVAVPADVDASLKEARGFAQDARTFLERGSTVDSVGAKIEATKAAANDLERGLKG